MISESRIENIESEVIFQDKDDQIEEIITNMSEFSDLIILGFNSNRKKSYNRVKKISDRLNTTLIVSAYDEILFRVN